MRLYLKTAILLIFLSSTLIAQQADTLRGRNLYRPKNTQQASTPARAEPKNIVQPQTDLIAKDTLTGKEADNTFEIDSVKQAFIQDSIYRRQLFVADSIAKREAFILDSIAKREAFIRDSIARRERILDSLNVLRAQLPKIIKACILNYTDDIFVTTSGLQIIGDSCLGDFNYTILPFAYTEPYTPWLKTIPFKDNPVDFKFDTVSKKVTSIKTGYFAGKITHAKHNLLILKGTSLITNKAGKKLFKSPIDSIFLDTKGNVLKVKKYDMLYNVVNYKKGSFYKKELTVVKQYSYSGSEFPSSYSITKFCNKGRGMQVCNIISHTLTKTGNNYHMTLNNDPANKYSDGTYDFEFTTPNYVSKVTFKNTGGSEIKNYIIEVNDDGFVSRYLYQINDKVHQTLLINYFLDDPNAKFKYETTTCIFEDDGICYFQRNNMRKLNRERSRYTGAWGPWEKVP